MRKFYLILTLVWIVIITFLCLVSFSETSFNTFQNTDKLVHFFFYFTLTLLMIKSVKNIKKNNYWSIILITISYGIVIEVLQGVFTETRKADFYDVLANSTGVIVAVLLNVYVINRISIRKFKI